MSRLVINNLVIAESALRAAREVLERNTLADEPRDAATLRKVETLISCAYAPVCGSLAVLQWTVANDDGEERRS